MGKHEIQDVLAKAYMFEEHVGDDVLIELISRAAERYEGDLTAYGPADFQLRIARVAGVNHLAVSFADPELEKARQAALAPGPAPASKAALEYVTERNSNETGLPIYRPTGCGGQSQRRRAHVRGFASRRSAKPLNCKQWDGTRGLGDYTRATATLGPASAWHPSDDFGRRDDSRPRSRPRAMSKRNTLVGPQLQRGRTGFNPDWKRLIAFLVVIVLGSIVATLVLANSYGFHPALRFNLFHVYPPWSYFVWAHQWDQPGNHALFAQAFGIGSMVTLGGFFVLLLDVARLNFRVNPYLHGSARWADLSDIKAAGLLNNDGVYVGAWRDKRGKIHYLRHAGPEHVLSYAPTRSGKGVGLIVPTLLFLEAKRVRDRPQGRALRTHRRLASRARPQSDFALRTRYGGRFVLL